MGRPVRIRKKKSFMFTTRHYSFMSIFGIVVAVLSIASGTWMVLQSYYNSGQSTPSFGGVGLFSSFLCIIGIVSGIYGLNERDVYIAPSIVAIALNALTVLAWLVLIVLAFLFGGK